MGRNRHRSPSPSVAEPRRPLLLAALSFVRAALIAGALVTLNGCEHLRKSW
jgi:hypothetical protein